MELPGNEAERLAALVSYGILDTGREKSFDRITHLAAQLFDAPIALISLIDSSRQWFKSAIGLEARQTPREVAFCAHAILGQGVFIIPDASADKRFADNPLVTGSPNIRFYAGAPLMAANDIALGTVCIIDRATRPILSTKEQLILQDLADMVVHELEGRKAVRQAARAMRAATSAIDTITPRLPRQLDERRSLQEAREQLAAATRVLQDSSPRGNS